MEVFPKGQTCRWTKVADGHLVCGDINGRENYFALKVSHRHQDSDVDHFLVSLTPQTTGAPAHHLMRPSSTDKVLDLGSNWRLDLGLGLDAPQENSQIPSVQLIGAEYFLRFQGRDSEYFGRPVFVNLGTGSVGFGGPLGANGPTDTNQALTWVGWKVAVPIPGAPWPGHVIASWPLPG